MSIHVTKQFIQIVSQPLYVSIPEILLTNPHCTATIQWVKVEGGSGSVSCDGIQQTLTWTRAFCPVRLCYSDVIGLLKLNHYFSEYSGFITDWYDSQNNENKSQIDLKTFRELSGFQTIDNTLLMCNLTILKLKLIMIKKKKKRNNLAAAN